MRMRIRIRKSMSCVGHKDLISTQKKEKKIIIITMRMYIYIYEKNKVI